ncbi:hypothetical protein BVRB_8g196740 [Beta vulgaris subsp. vulgaris]|nr:hypothetical protein BVRB_8g196740 [Beta vulgaris subsp. vulgaris]
MLLLFFRKVVDCNRRCQSQRDPRGVGYIDKMSKSSFGRHTLKCSGYN